MFNCFCKILQHPKINPGSALAPNNANGQNEKAINEKHINFHILDQKHFQEFNNNFYRCIQDHQ